MQLLKDTVLFHSISEEEIQRILKCSRAKVITFAANEYIFRQGEKPRYLFLLQRGSVHIEKNFASGKRDLIYLVPAGDVFGENYLFADMNAYWYDAVAATECQILQFPWNFFYQFCHNACEHHQKLTRNMLEIQSRKNFSMTKKLHILAGSSLREKIAIWLLENRQEGTDYCLVPRREDMADYLGVARPSLSREMMHMQSEGMILVEKDRIHLIDLEALEELYG
ncbi:MAG: Crp/Fnr family transcriptional regulator [Lachnospiraceae bacterium]